MGDIQYHALGLGEVGKRWGKPAPVAVVEAAYESTGCDLWGDCLSCPLPRCRYDMTPEQLLEALDELTRPG